MHGRVGLVEDGDNVLSCAGCVTSLEVASTWAKPSTWWCMDKVLVLSNMHGQLGLIGKACDELVPSTWQQLGVAIT